jgi:hypothetical protein
LSQKYPQPVEGKKKRKSRGKAQKDENEEEIDPEIVSTFIHLIKSLVSINNVRTLINLNVMKGF